MITRGITGTIRSRASKGAAAGPIKDITIGGVHIHHQVFGIVTMFVAGLLIIATDAQDAVLNTLALLFGIGAGLAFDEFALWLRLDDVYWSRQGRKSIDAVAWTLVVTASVRTVLDLSTVFEGVAEAGSMWWLPVLLFLLTVAPAGICAAKGKLVTAALGIVYQPIGLVGAFRLAKPGSWWDRGFCGPTSRRRRRAERRFGFNYHGRWERLRDLVGGAPSDQAPESGAAGSSEAPIDSDGDSTQRCTATGISLDGGDPSSGH